MKRAIALLLCFILLLPGGAAYAELDISGSWIVTDFSNIDIDESAQLYYFSEISRWYDMTFTFYKSGSVYISYRVRDPKADIPFPYNLITSRSESDYKNNSSRITLGNVAYTFSLSNSGTALYLKQGKSRMTLSRPESYKGQGVPQISGSAKATASPKITRKPRATVRPDSATKTPPTATPRPARTARPTAAPRPSATPRSVITRRPTARPTVPPQTRQYTASDLEGTWYVSSLYDPQNKDMQKDNMFFMFMSLAGMHVGIEFKEGTVNILGDNTRKNETKKLVSCPYHVKNGRLILDVFDTKTVSVIMSILSVIAVMNGSSLSEIDRDAVSTGFAVEGNTLKLFTSDDGSTYVSFRRK